MQLTFAVEHLAKDIEAVSVEMAQLSGEVSAWTSTCKASAACLEHAPGVSQHARQVSASLTIFMLCRVLRAAAVG